MSDLSAKTQCQRFPDGTPEQITAGATEEEGLAIAPDGRSLITSMALRQSIVILHDAAGERQVSLEGYSFDPKFSRDGKRLFYRILKGAIALSDPSELRVVDLETGQNRAVMAGVPVAGYAAWAYDISPDGAWVVASAKDPAGKWRLWTAPSDGTGGASQIAAIEGSFPAALSNETILFRGPGGNWNELRTIRRDGSDLKRVLDRGPGSRVRGISPDGKWVLVWKPGTPISAFPIDGDDPVPLLALREDIFFRWSSSAVFISMPESSGMGMSGLGQTYVLPLRPGEILPRAPHGGFKSEAEIAKVPGVKVIRGYDLSPGPTPDVYAYSKRTGQRNLYRIPLP